jgi:hypothetical protein
MHGIRDRNVGRTSNFDKMVFIFGKFARSTRSITSTNHQQQYYAFEQWIHYLTPFWTLEFLRKWAFDDVKEFFVCKGAFVLASVVSTRSEVGDEKAASSFTEPLNSLLFCGEVNEIIYCDNKAHAHN